MMACHPTAQQIQVGKEAINKGCCHVGDDLHTQNIQVNKLIGENEKCIFYFKEQSIQTFWPTRYYTPCFALGTMGEKETVPFAWPTGQ